MKSHPPIAPARRFGLILLLIVLLPALLYSVYAVNSLSADEALMGEIYQRQLNVVLFSLNQYAWDVASSWTSSIEALVNDAPKTETRTSLSRRFLERTPSVIALFFADSALTSVSLVPRDGAELDRARIGKTLTDSLRENRERLDRLLRYRREEYRKLEPLVFTDSASAVGRVCIVFALPDPYGGQSLAGFFLDETSFIRDVLGPRIQEAAGAEFLFAVLRSGAAQPVYATGAISPEEIRQRKELWLFPDLYLGIKLRGTTIDDVLRARFLRNLVLIILLDVVLLAGAWLVYRTIRREMDLVRLKSDFISTVSHELRTPLSLIRMYAETLEMGRIKDDARKQEYLTTILRESERLSRLVNNILSFSKMEAGKKQYQFRAVDLNKVVASVLGTFEDHLRNQNFSADVRLSPSLPPVHADEEAVAEAVINILDNAIKYSPDERHISVRTGVAGPKAFVEIEDRGIGIASEHHGKIFETFYRVSSGLVHNTKGSGLGLALVKHIVAAHKGTIELSSSPGKGSTFRILLPLENSNG